MSLSQALATAVSGLRTTQSGLSVIAANVANSETPGYVKKVAVPVTISAAGGANLSVRTGTIQRTLDQYVQRQLRTETSGASYAALRSDFYSRLQTLYGDPASSTSLEGAFNTFSASLQALKTSPDDAAARSSVISAAQVMVQQLSSLSTGVQNMRADAELGLSDAVSTANNAMQQIAAINQQIGASNQEDASTAALLDQRDTYIDQLSKLMDINVVTGDRNQVRVFTTTGLELVGLKAQTLSFDAQGTVTADNVWSADPSKRSLGTIKLTSDQGTSIDLIANNAIRSGQISAYLQMRDVDLPQAQAQLDAVAAALASTLSDTTTAGTPVTSGGQSGFEVDLGGLLDGNRISVSYQDATGKLQTLTFMRVDDAAARAKLPAGVIGFNGASGVASIASQVSSALSGLGMIASAAGGNVLRVLDDTTGRATVAGASVTTTASGFSGNGLSIPFFLDGSAAYTGGITAQGQQMTGLSSRLRVNAALVADPSLLVSYQSGTSSGDATRPSFLYDRLTSAATSFSSATGIGTSATPFAGSLPAFLRQIISQQGDAAQSAKNLSDGQSVVLTALLTRFNEGSSVSIDEEMSNLLKLQNAYSANARVMSAVKDMLDSLMSSMR